MAAGVTDVVLDTSVIAAYAFKETNRAFAVPICEKVIRNELTAYVPDLMCAELQNVCHRKRDERGLSLADIESAYEDALALPLVEQDNCLLRHRSDAWDLVRRIPEVGSYDMYFLALAVYLDLPLWTFDKQMKEKVEQVDRKLATRLAVVGIDPTV